MTNDPHRSEPKGTTLEGFATSLNPAWKLEDWFHWPPDLFALTSLLLKSTGGYRYAANPPELPWPNYEDWKEEVDQASFQWYAWIFRDQDTLPDVIKRNQRILRKHWKTTSLERVGEISEVCHEWELCRSVLELHAIADAACAGFGHPLGHGGVDYLANMLLASTGSLSRLPRHKVLVLPKMRTPSVGITLRSLSHYVTVHQSEVDVVWRTTPWINSDENTINILVIPWPFEVEPTSFQPEYHSVHRNGRSPSRYFKYTGDPACKKLPVGQILAMIKQTASIANRVHMIVLPELALCEGELIELKNALVQEIRQQDRMPMLITGLRRDRNDPKAATRDSGAHRLDRNQVVLSIFFAGKWYDLRQDKHHRWKLDGHQIQQYGLGGALAGNLEWWEAIEVPRRKITFLSPNDWLTLCPLICEDLARLEPVSELIRGVGPTLLIALLLDGPQLRARWSGRYASVLADDPGTSVLTITSLGMAARSQPVSPKDDEPPRPANRTIALWKDEVRGWKEIRLAEDEHAVLLTIAASWGEEHTADGRSDGGNAARFVLQGCHALALPEISNSVERDQLLFEPDEPIDVIELTRFTYLADAMIDEEEEIQKDLRNWALGEIRDGWLERQFRGKDSVLQRIVASVELCYDKHEKQLAPVPDSSKQVFGIYVDWLLHLVMSAPPRESPVENWKRLVEVAEQELPCEKPAASDDVLSRIISAHEGIDPNRYRVRLLSSLALLWGVHKRLSHQRRQGQLSPYGTNLLEHIERLLAREYPPGASPPSLRAQAAGG